ncbi:MAG: response regulator [Bacteroidetes bacterium]|nr:response regulator [Bacteroidota bacterium]MBI3483039.1 response regulator [Bacteroidota bacterium]
MKTLIVEDNNTSSKLLQVVLKAEGFETIAAKDGQEALQILESQKVECIVSDVMMPNIDGYRLLYKVRRDNRFKDIPFILYTASSLSPEDEEFAIRLGANKYLRKTGNTKDVAHAVCELLKQENGALKSGENQVSPDQWVMERYNSLLLDKLEDKIGELEKTKQELRESLDKETEAKSLLDQLNQHLEEKVSQRTAQLEESNKELEAFSYSVSHDLRTPLRSISGYAKMLEEDYENTIDEEGKRLLRLIRQSAATMGILVDDLLAFSRLGRKDIIKTNINMTEVVEEIIWETKKVINHDAEIKINPLHPSQADKSLIKQVFVNLISNAIKYSSKKKTPRIILGSEEKNAEIVYYVKDNGAGFDMTFVNKLFNVFQRLHSLKEFEGTGIGLALVKRIIEKHSGRVWAEGKENEGATFYFSLPVN